MHVSTRVWFEVGVGSPVAIADLAPVGVAMTVRIWSVLPIAVLVLLLANVVVW